MEDYSQKLTPASQELFKKYLAVHPYLQEMSGELLSAFAILDSCYSAGNKVLLCGNGGSAADADHIVGELMKGFAKKRPLSAEFKANLAQYGETGVGLAESLQDALPAINLCAHSSLMTAVANDIGGDQIFAQQVVGFGRPNDVLWGISTSGNSKNVIQAAIVAKARGLKVVGLTGSNVGRLDALCDEVIKVPSINTPDIQDMHSSIFHLLCLLLEAQRWDC